VTASPPVTIPPPHRRRHYRAPPRPTGAPREHYFQGMAQLGDMSDEERRERFIKNDNFFIE
jgi:hypothetical protein